MFFFFHVNIKNFGWVGLECPRLVHSRLLTHSYLICNNSVESTSVWTLEPLVYLSQWFNIKFYSQFVFPTGIMLRSFPLPFIRSPCIAAEKVAVSMWLRRGVSIVQCKHSPPQSLTQLPLSASYKISRRSLFLF